MFGEDRIPKAPDQTSYPAGHAQTRLYLAHTMDKAGASAFNISTALPAGNDFDCDALREALRRLVRRQESLRTSFVEVDGNILQCVAPTAEPALVIEDVSESDAPTTECLRLIRRDVGTAFDLTQAPLLRARAIWTGASGWIVLLVLHHIVGDGWSMQILFRELSILYRDARAGLASALPSLPIAYRDFTRWSAGKDWTEAARNRRAALIGAPDQIALPVDHPSPPQPFPSWRHGQPGVAAGHCRRTCPAWAGARNDDRRSRSGIVCRSSAPADTPSGPCHWHGSRRPRASGSRGTDRLLRQRPADPVAGRR